MGKGKGIINQDTPKWGVRLFFLLLLMGVAYSAVVGEQVYYYDAWWYWNIASPVTESGHFDLMAFPETFRGYFFPMLLLLFQELHLNWNPLINGMMAATFAFSLPYLLQGKRIATFSSALRIALAYAAFLCVWGDFLQSPLSDIPAAAMMIAGSALIRSLLCSKSHVQTALRAFCAGVCLYAAYNTRAVFLYGICILLVLLVVTFRRDWKKLSISLTCLAVGIALIALPQCLINYQYIGSFNPKVYTEQLYDYSSDLQLNQVLWGISIPKYETYIGAPSGYPNAGVRFIDPIGTEIIAREGISIDTFSYGLLLKLGMKYPMDFVGLYVKHLLVGMTPTWKNPYISDVHTQKGLLITVSIVIWLIAGLNVLENCRKKRWSSAVWYCIAVALPSLLQMVGAVEVRFLAPLYLMVYYYVFAGIDYAALWEGIRDRVFSILVVMLVIFAMWTSIIGSVLSMNTEMTFLIHDHSTVQDVQ